MSTKFRTVITTAGAAKLAAATAPGGRKVNITTMAVGDGGGKLPVPDAGQTGLIHEVWRHALNKISQDKRNSNYIIAELVIPPEVGGFWMRELGLYDDAGTLIAVANMAESYKPALAEGSGRSQTCRMVIIVSSVTSVALTIDTTTVMATQDYVDDKIAEHEQSRRHPDASLTAKGFTQLSSATNSTSETLAATPKAVKAAYDLANGKYTAQDATTARKGLVQLSSATNSTSETFAATPKAVKAAYDLANGKYTAQDATTARKGLVQLSSATNSDSETLAATPKAVKVAYDLANGKYTAQDATTARKGLVQLSSATNSDSETLAATPKAVKSANDNAEKRLQKDKNGADIPDKRLFLRNIGATNSTTMSFSGGTGWFRLATVTMPQASSVVYISLIGGAGYNVNSPMQAGISELVLRAGNGNPKGLTGTLWRRTSVGFTNFAWVNTSGDTYDVYVEIGNYATGVNIQWDYTSNASVTIHTSPTYTANKPTGLTDGTVYIIYSSHIKPTAADVGALSLSGGQLNGALGIGTSSALGGNSIVLGDNDTGFKQNGDGNLDVYANNVHVMRFVSGSIQSNKTINITGRVNPSDYGNFDSRYVRDIRLGGAATYKPANNGMTWTHQAPSGCVYSGIIVQDTGSNSADNIGGVYYRPVQKYINGTWYNVAQV
ncbi:TPA: tail fiber protein [Salmonella enterica subsp. enterica serovar Typhi]|nr:tail fiber protein [Salmonella enterica]EJG7277814.1 tail fiber protein [Escherichia coli]HAD5237727.1 phage tail protein [Salmonella enterica subsp. enterica serovar Typhi str. CT18]HDW4144169.1 tail fiber protein [Salmonella enterica subsp. enterica serovar Typhi]HDW4148789.1 tail fiber protein [Salmonella enterica subsp. enterica serovar Typhi]HDW4223682.1 tail fiber protein [Salmonella enterica subsp. enterica serovar Typhi]